MKKLTAAALIACGFALLYRHVFVKLVHDWWTDGNYSHGFLIIPVSLYLAWERRAEFTSAPNRPTAFGLLIVTHQASPTAL